MKKYLNLSLLYAILAMIGGVFYREFTKFNSFSGVTMLGKVHAHLFILGMFMFLIVALFRLALPLEEQKTFRIFMVVYNIGLPITAMMMVLRGVIQVLKTNITPGINASISGIAGIGHILLGVGLVMFIVSLSKAEGSKN